MMKCPSCNKPMKHFDGDRLFSEEDAKKRARMIHETGCESGWICSSCDKWVGE